MTSHKKPASRRPVFDASFGLYSLNKNTPEKSYHDAEYEFHFPSVDNLADTIAALGSGCYLFKRDRITGFVNNCIVFRLYIIHY